MRKHWHGIHGVLGLRRVRFTVAVLATLAGVVAVVKGCGPPRLRQIGAVRNLQAQRRALLSPPTADWWPPARVRSMTGRSIGWGAPPSGRPSGSPT